MEIIDKKRGSIREVEKIEIVLENGATIRLLEKFGALEIMNGDGKIMIEGNSSNLFYLHCAFE